MSSYMNIHSVGPRTISTDRPQESNGDGNRNGKMYHRDTWWRWYDSEEDDDSENSSDNDTGDNNIDMVVPVMITVFHLTRGSSLRGNFYFKGKGSCDDNRYITSAMFIITIPVPVWWWHRFHYTWLLTLKRLLRQKKR